MMQITKRCVFIFCLMLLVLSPMTYAAKRAIPYQVLYQDSDHYSDVFANKTIMVIRDWNSYTDAVVKHSSDEIIDVNFSESQVVLIDMGNRPDTGYGLKVARVLEFDDHIVVYTKFTVGSSSCGLFGQAITNPIAIIKVDSQKEIIVREKFKSFECNDN
ncbi:hypothetical protein FE810_11010 [Thalassotalea litorea]|uniref:PrcB C-terminal domain-containing protein n=1 Tax=Thalassotalea litorea TaxID=2020715 RepID=A0A5R9IJG3_9GAMM|nr:protease complex subunit PrcB family protein [Thalassotalea litorea]TLU64613.1 hypothetical protein FE810_11010 [Thalassotalea litorea]